MKVVFCEFLLIEFDIFFICIFKNKYFVNCYEIEFKRMMFLK